ncbi:MAG: hypothetical protein ABSE48_01355 [Verrucomicrobiota bacterium]|jgi:hypothetical protein
MSETTTAAAWAVPERLRPLKWNERVRHGDFVENGNQGFEPWTGPGGFRADAFVKQIYRQQGRRKNVVGKPL